MARFKSDDIQMVGTHMLANEQTSYHARKIAEAKQLEGAIIEEANLKAKEILIDASQQASIIVENAKSQALSEVDDIVARAKEEGFKAGHAEGFAKNREESMEKIESIEKFCHNQFEIKRNIIKSAHVDIVNLALQIAQKVCNNALRIDAGVMREITLSAIGMLKDKEAITIIVNPEMAKNIYEIGEELKTRVAQLQTIRVVEDRGVSQDGVIVEGILSRVDGRISSQINEIADRLMCELNSNEELNG